MFFSDFSQKTGFDIPCKLSPLETICMECQILFSGKNKKNIINVSFAELAQKVVKVNPYPADKFNWPHPFLTIRQSDYII